MKKLTDENQSLDWLLIDYEYDWTKEESRNTIIDIIRKLNNWQGESIDKFITSMPLGEHLQDICDIVNDNYDITQCFHALAYIDDTLVGTAVITSNSKDIRESFNTFTLPNNLKILYLIVNPEYQNLGIGTRMIKSITEHQEFFSQGKKTFGISTNIHNENIPSQRAFLKNKFTFYAPCKNSKIVSQYFYIDKKERLKDLVE